MELGSSLSIKGQVTIPKEVREVLGLKAGDRVAIVPDGERAILVSVKGDFLGLKGVFKKQTKGHPLTPQAMREKAKRFVREGYASHRWGPRGPEGPRPKA